MRTRPSSCCTRLLVCVVQPNIRAIAVRPLAGRACKQPQASLIRHLASQAPKPFGLRAGIPCFAALHLLDNLISDGTENYYSPWDSCPCHQKLGGPRCKALLKQSQTTAPKQVLDTEALARICGSRTTQEQFCFWPFKES
jgi:hypothetical protein